MKLLQKIGEGRGEMTAVLECEHCGFKGTWTTLLVNENIGTVRCLKCGRDRQGNETDVKVSQNEGSQLPRKQEACSRTPTESDDIPRNL
jgi:transcription elongation factor Elf1